MLARSAGSASVESQRRTVSHCGACSEPHRQDTRQREREHSNVQRCAPDQNQRHRDREPECATEHDDQRRPHHALLRHRRHEQGIRERCAELISRQRENDRQRCNAWRCCDQVDGERDQCDDGDACLRAEQIGEQSRATLGGTSCVLANAVFVDAERRGRVHEAGDCEAVGVDAHAGRTEVSRHDEEQHEVQQVRADAAREQPGRIATQLRRGSDDARRRGLDDLATHFEVATRNFIDVEPAGDRPAGGSADGRQGIALIQSVVQRRGQRGRIAHGDQPAFAPITDHLGCDADGRRHARQSRRHCFDERQAEPLALAGRHEQIAGLQVLVDVLDVAGERHPRIELRCANGVAQLLLAAVERAIAAANEHQVRVRMLPGDLRPDLDEHRQPFGSRQASGEDHEQSVGQPQSPAQWGAFAPGN